MKQPDHRSLSLPDQKISAFFGLSEGAASLLSLAVRFRKVKKKELLLREGNVCKHLYYIEQGCVRTYYNKEGQEVNLSFYMERQFVTDLKSLRSGKPSEYFIQAIEPCAIWELDKDKLLQLYNESAEINSFGRNLLEQLLCEQEEQANRFKWQTPKERYQYLQASQPLLIQRVPLIHLASYLGISRETVSRIRKSIL